MTKRDDGVPARDPAAEAPPSRTAVTRVRLRDFSLSLPMSLLRAREAVMRQFRPSLAAFNLTEQQWRVLRALTAVDEIEVLALADRTFLLASSLSRILRGLEDRELIRRRTDERDQRRGLISISPAGAALIERAGVHSERIYAEITRRYGAEQLAQLQAALRALEAALPAELQIAEDLGLERGGLGSAFAGGRVSAADEDAGG